VEQRFGGKVVLITGAASGIGRATAQLFAADGAMVGCSDIAEEGLAKTVQVITQAGGQAIALAGNVADPDSAEATVAACVDRYGKLNVLCNVAGVGNFVHTAEASNEHWNRIIGVNLSGTFFMSRSALPHLLKEEGSNIVNVASTAGMMGQAYSAAYCASKWGVVGLTKAMAVEFAKRGLRVNCVCPGGVKTAILSGFLPPEGADRKLVDRMSLVEQFTEPSEIAPGIADLAPDVAGSVTGTTLSIDNGVAAA